MTADQKLDCAVAEPIRGNETVIAAPSVPSPDPSDVRSGAPLGSGLPRIDALDGVRGIAVLLVLFYHFRWTTDTFPEALGTWPNRLCVLGWCGVDLFFVLSGFLITGILIRTKTSPNYFRNFYMRRVLRIFPLYFGVLLVFAFIIPLFLKSRSTTMAVIWHNQIWFWLYLSNMADAIYGPINHYLNHFWSLAVEEQFYFVWPAIVLLCSPKRLGYICIACLIVSPVLRAIFIYKFGNVVAAYRLSPCRADSLAAGAFLAVLSQSGTSIRVLKAAGFAAAITATAAIIACGHYASSLLPEEPLTCLVAHSAFAIGFFGVISVVITASKRGIINRWLTNGVLMVVGKYSYGMYVYHLLLANPLRWIFLDHFLKHLPIPPSDVLICYMVLATITTFGIAAISYNCFELYFLKLKRYF